MRLRLVMAFARLMRVRIDVHGDAPVDPTIHQIDSARYNQFVKEISEEMVQKPIEA